MQLPVYNTTGDVVERLEFRDDVFAIPMNSALVHQEMVRQLANRRIGTAQTKTRGMVSGGGRKPYRQKGTGRARQGSTRAAHFRGGGVVFGPHPRDYRQDMPKKARRLAFKCVLADKAQSDRLVLLNELALSEIRTKEMVAILGNLPVQRSILIALPRTDETVQRSARNIPNVKTTLADTMNLVDMLRYQYVVMPVEAARQIESRLGSPSAE